MSSIFLSYSHSDKPFARRLARDLRNAGARVWIDEGEIRIGDSLIRKIQEGIDSMEFVGAIISAESSRSPWVQHELDIAMNDELKKGHIKVLPLVIEHCELPGFLKGKMFADFRIKKNYDDQLLLLIERLELDRYPSCKHRFLDATQRTKYLTECLNKVLQRQDRPDDYRIRISAVTSSFALNEAGLLGDQEYRKLLLEETRLLFKALSCGINFSCLLYPTPILTTSIPGNIARARLRGLLDFIKRFGQAGNVNLACALSRPGNQYIFDNDILVEAFTHTPSGGYENTTVVTEESLVLTAVAAFERDFRNAQASAWQILQASQTMSVNKKQAGLHILMTEITETLSQLSA